ncbi:hypothetical protein ASF32_17345 [Methylobacterium sp. Leaf91]|nr:hypothetical protein ASF24_19395 [Methylobacterium sp. Leaf86]KQO95950.1 hypothetical protein ASF32_17345 [Methylobacterium sp. Leaf91]
MRRFFATGLALALVMILDPARAATVEVVVEGIEPGAGAVYVALCQGGLSETECRNGQDVPADGRSQRVILTGIEPGAYAVAAYQDLNGNRRLDRTGLGLPLEPYGFSGEAARARPDFARARVVVREPGLALRVRLVRALPPR